MGKRGNGNGGKTCDGGVTGSKKDPEPKKVITVRVSDIQPVSGHKDEVSAIYSDAQSIHEFGRTVCFCLSVLIIQNGLQVARDQKQVAENHRAVSRIPVDDVAGRLLAPEPMDTSVDGKSGDQDVQQVANLCVFWV